MKRLIIYIGLFLSLASCASQEDLDKLTRRVNDLENLSISSAKEQMASIEVSISSLENARISTDSAINALEKEYITLYYEVEELKKDEAASSKEIDALKEFSASNAAQIELLKSKSDELGEQIEDLKAYADTLNSGTMDWFKATFATIARMDSVQQSIAVFKTMIPELQEQISAVQDSVARWVGISLEGYVTLAELQAASKEVLAKASAAASDTRDSVNAVVKVLNADIASVKKELDATVKSAVNAALSDGGVITAAVESLLKEASVKLTSRVDSLKTSITDLQKSDESLRSGIDSLSARLSALEAWKAETVNQIQSIVCVPSATGGSVGVYRIIKTDLLFEIRPLSAAQTLVNASGSKNFFKFQAAVAHPSKVPSYKDFTVNSVSMSGDLVKVNVSFPDDKALSKGFAVGDSTLVGRLLVEAYSGHGNYVCKTSDHCPLSVLHDYVEIGGKKWSLMNLGAASISGSPSTCFGDYYAWGATEPWLESYDLSESGVNMSGQVWKSGKSDGYIKKNAPYYDGSGYVKYSSGTVLQAGDDAATVSWGQNWRTPTVNDFKALHKACTGSEDSCTPSSLTSSNPTGGVYWLYSGQTYLLEYTGSCGLLYVDAADTSKKLFLPAAGYFNGTTFEYSGDSPSGYYNTANCTGGTSATAFKVSNGEIKFSIAWQRYYGNLIRPISD